MTLACSPRSTAGADYSENPPWHGPDISYALLQKLLGTEGGGSLAEQPTLDPDLIAQVEAHVQQVMAANGIPGASVSIAKDGEIAYEQGFGVAEYGADRAMTPQTQSLVGCLTGGFTAAAIIQLADQGLVDLDARGTDYLPYFKLADEAGALVPDLLLMLGSDPEPAAVGVGDRAAQLMVGLAAVERLLDVAPQHRASRCSPAGTGCG